MPKTSLIIINDRNRRGVIAPRRLVSKKLLEDMIDLIELSRPEAIKEIETRIKEADRKESWIPFEKVYVCAKKS